MDSVKVTLIGTPQCGKTSLIHRYLYDQFVDKHNPTTAELYSTSLSYVCLIGIWDTGGEALQHRKAIIPESDFILICFKASDDTPTILKVNSNQLQ